MSYSSWKSQNATFVSRLKLRPGHTFHAAFRSDYDHTVGQVSVREMVLDSKQRSSHLSSTCPSPLPPDSVPASDPWSDHADYSFSDCGTRVVWYFLLSLSDQTKGQYLPKLQTSTWSGKKLQRN
ncbi:hypothetical protein JTB14_035251 [Gonioctena quinquepunctata]|nr:hypothetical protein JTB14_035251 [Gonioctena quinquepunctata]